MPKLNVQQSDVIRSFKAGDSIAVNAVAGSGKTTTALAIQKVVPQDICYVAFTNAAKNVMTKRCPDINCKTTYSMGMSALRGFQEDIEVDPNKIWRLASQQVDKAARGALRAVLGNQKLAIVGILKDLVTYHLLDLIEDPVEWRKVVLERGVDLYSFAHLEDWLFDTAKVILHEAFQEFIQEGTLDFTEMIAYPSLIEEVEFTLYDRMIVDEAQDLSRAQQNLVWHSLVKGGQIAFVGDPHQAIFGFAGADFRSFDQLKQRFNCKDLPMEYNYRCGHAIIELAQEYVPYIKAHKGQTTHGEVLFDKPRYTELKGNLMILSRTHARLLEQAIMLIHGGKRFQYVGNKIGSKLKSAMIKFEKQPLADLESLIKAWNAKHSNEPGAANMADLHSCLLILYKETKPKTWASFQRKIMAFFNKLKGNTGSLKLSTVHAAKGDEAASVWFLDLYRPINGTESQVQQELNLNYVGITRAKEKLWVGT